MTRGSSPQCGHRSTHERRPFPTAPGAPEYSTIEKHRICKVCQVEGRNKDRERDAIEAWIENSLRDSGALNLLRDELEQVPITGAARNEYKQLNQVETSIDDCSCEQLERLDIIPELSKEGDTETPPSTLQDSSVKAEKGDSGSNGRNNSWPVIHNSVTSELLQKAK